jgi:hypothetical protein
MEQEITSTRNTNTKGTLEYGLSYMKLQTLQKTMCRGGFHN